MRRKVMGKDKRRIGKKKIATVEDLKEVAYFNRIVENYMKILRLEDKWLPDMGYNQ